MARSKAKSRPKSKSAAKGKPARKAYAKPKAAKAKAAKAKGTQPIPEGFGTITAHLVIEGAGDAMDFYKRAFGAKELGRMPGPDGQRLMHGLMQIGDSMVMVVDAFEEWGVKGPKGLGGSAVTLHVYVPDVDYAFQRAVDAGCSVATPLTDMFWGDRYGKLKDPFGHEWSFATHVRDMTPAEMDDAMRAAFAQPQPGS
jgi:uncharacterized glyoxalase superfamily protein PhnB